MDKQPFVKELTFRRKLLNRIGACKSAVLKYARFGYMAKGIVYMLIGILALLAATGLKGKLTGQEGAMYTLAKQPFGPFLLIVLAAGLAGYTFWQVVRAIFDPECASPSWKRWFARAGYLIIAGIYTTVCISALRILFRARVDTSDKGYQTLSQKMLAQPFGQLIIGLAGIVFIVIGVVMLYQAISGRFKKRFKKNEMNKQEWRWSGYVGTFGMSARAVVFIIIGIFLIRTAYTSDPKETKGLDGALAELASQPYGPLQLGIVALGFISYGVYMFAHARYRRLHNN
ncbi:DUF1206 domain-containing protein [Fictibacillus aquaticus]|uniref:DUF1206 domain-containing protein n=1 Tax=Fictibacillus aquaticus TaxID=2021314 RepID=A0A235FE69_9BACL|nr:DUF1206 domain-containing protein [Fictibacillus aquaticus]OYD59227.1 hypothetical protein CGZ90_04830 [Fictibacillus aquaticus]